MEHLYRNHRVVYFFAYFFTYSLLFLLITFLFYCIISLLCGIFFFKLFAIYVLNILKYMNKQQKPGKTALICCRDAKADLGLRCPHMEKEPFSHDMALS